MNCGHDMHMQQQAPLEGQSEHACSHGPPAHLFVCCDNCTKHILVHIRHKVLVHAGQSSCIEQGLQALAAPKNNLAGLTMCSS